MIWSKVEEVESLDGNQMIEFVIDLRAYYRGLIMRLMKDDQKNFVTNCGKDDYFGFQSYDKTV